MNGITKGQRNGRAIYGVKRLKVGIIMKIKKLVALALAGTMVFSMAACEGKKDDEKGSANSKVKNTADVAADEGKKQVNKEETGEIIDIALAKFEEFTKEQDKNYSYGMEMTMKMESEGIEVSMEMDSTSSSYDGVVYTMSNTKAGVLGETEEIIEEMYTITKEDGTVVTAMKTSEDDEWYVDTEDTVELENVEEPNFDIDAIKDAVKIEKKGDNYYLTMEISAADMGLDEDELMLGLSEFDVAVIVVYNEKQDEITEVEMKMDLDAINEMTAAFGDVNVEEFTMKMVDIKKNDKPIEIPAEIELD